MEVANRTNNATQPQTWWDGHGHGHPATPALALGIQFVGLDMLQVQRVIFQEVVVKVLAVSCGLGLPVGDGSFVEVKGGDDGLEGATVGQQGDDEDEQGGVLVEAIEGRALGGGEGLAAGSAAVALFLVGVHRDVALALPPSGRAGRVGTELAVGVHGMSPAGSDGRRLSVRIFLGPPFGYSPPLSRFSGVLPT